METLSIVTTSAKNPECVICGKDHNAENCDYIKITKHISDNAIPPKAQLTLPSFLTVQKYNDGSYFISTSAFICKGTKFGPFQAEKVETLEPSITFPLKIFSDQSQCFLDNNNEDKCSWLMYVGCAEYLEEQNLICYQEFDEIYYVAIKDINVGDVLKVWYAPYYAAKMDKPMLTPKCDIVYSDKNVDVNQLIKKQQKVMERKIWTCKFCSQMENNIVSFAKHMIAHYSAQHKNMCEICKKSFGSKKYLKTHMKAAHSVCQIAPPPPKAPKSVSTNLQCSDVALGGPLLNDIFTDSTDLQQFDLSIDNQNLLLDADSLTDNFLTENVKDFDHFNFEIDDNQKQFVCDICLKQFNKVKLLIVHLKHHTGDYTCFKCLKIFCRNENLRSHICNLSANFPCNLCGKKFTQNKYLTRHLVSVHDKKYKCAACGKHYYSNKELLEHNCSKVPNKDKEKFMCPICDKVFLRDNYLKKHVKRHARHSTRSATCEICGLHLKNRNSYYLHKKKHLEPSYECKVCLKKFCRKDSLKEHASTHNETKVECAKCSKKFKNQRIFNRHIRKHYPENICYVNCPTCNVRFKTRPCLNKHIRKFHSETDKSALIEYFDCPVCEKSIKLKSSLLRHLKNLHNVTNVDFGCIKRKVLAAEPKKRKKTTEAETREKEMDEEINTLLNIGEGPVIENLALENLVKELEKNGEEREKDGKEVCLSIPDLGENYQEIMLDKNAYILDNGTIVQPQGDSEKVVIYVLEQS